MTQTMKADYAHYNTPGDIATDDTLSLPRKTALLNAWAVDSRALLRASSEGMAPTDTTTQADTLKAVETALSQLNGENTALKESLEQASFPEAKRQAKAIFGDDSAPTSS